MKWFWDMDFWKSLAFFFVTIIGSAIAAVWMTSLLTGHS